MARKPANTNPKAAPKAGAKGESKAEAKAATKAPAKAPAKKTRKARTPVVSAAASARTLAQLKAEIAELEAQAAAIFETEKADTIAKARKAIEFYGITAEQLGFARARATRGTAAAAPAGARGGKRRAKPAKAGKIAPRYRDDQGNTWTGRGLKPRWLTAALAEGRTLESFLIKSEG